MAVPFKVRLRNKATGNYMPASAVPSVPYEAASQAPRLVRWMGSSGGPNAMIGSGIVSLRQRSRDRRRNDGVADSAVEILTANVVGTGIKPQFATSDAGLNKELAELFLEWTDEADADGRCDFYGLQGLAFSGMMEGGDTFARMRTRRSSDGLSVPLQLQLLEAEYCPVEKNEALTVGWVQQGIEFDGIGRRAAYWLHRDHPLDASVSLRSYDNLPQPVTAADVVHLSGVRRPGMIRGEPWLTRALVKLYDTDQVDDAMVQRIKLGAMFAGFVTPDAEGKFALQQVTDSGGVALAPMEPGSLQALPAGAEINFTDPPESGNGYEPFMKSQMRRVAASVGLLYEQLSGDYENVNDRTWRAAMNEFYRRLERIQHQLVVFQFCRPIMRRWLELAVLSGAIRLPRAVTLAQAARPKWIPQARPYINPLQDVQAKIAEIRGGLTSRSQKVSEAGYEGEQVDAEVSHDNKRADSLGIIYDSDARNVSKTGVKQIDAPADIANT